jgi:predicted  nucleic acid-binding Zn-ribbon protein
MTNLGSLINNAEALSQTLKTSVDDFLRRLIAMRDSALEVENTLTLRKASAQRELEWLDGEIEKRKEEHRLLEASLANLKEGRDQLLKMFAA